MEGHISPVRTESLSIRPNSALLQGLVPRADDLDGGSSGSGCCGRSRWSLRKKICAAVCSLFVVVLVATAVVGLLVYEGRNRFPAMPAPCTKDCLDVDSSLWTDVLEEFTVRRAFGPYTLTVVNYSGLMARQAQAGPPSNMTRYIDLLAGLDLARLNDTVRKAVFLNAYNCFTINMVVSHPCDGVPCSSINDIGNLIVPVWKKAAGTVGGLTFSLDNIEQDYLRVHFHDPRVHSGMNCASISCPDLRREAYETAALSAQLDNQFKVWLSSKKRAFDLDESGELLTLNKIFDWYGSDFTPSVPLFIAPFAPNDEGGFVTQHASSLVLRYFDYDWSLNGV